jgi:hypothetical protein
MTEMVTVTISDSRPGTLVVTETVTVTMSDCPLTRKFAMALIML